MSTVTTYDRYLERVGAGARLSPEEIRELADTPDILALGMLADALRRRLHQTRVTFLRVAESPFEKAFADGIPAAARELRLTGAPDDLVTAVRAVETARAAGGGRTIAAFTWADIERWSQSVPLAQVLARLTSAGLDAIADLPLDGMRDLDASMASLASAGFRQLRLTVSKAPARDRTDLLLRAGALQDRHGCIQSINPLPMSLGAFRPTTGYEDVKMVAIARLAAPTVPSIQVDWRRYGPKLAQVALTFGADDVDGVSASDEAPEGRRRAPLEEIRRNIEAAGLSAAERDGRFAVLS